MQFDPDGKWLYSLSADGNLIVCDFETNRQEHSLQHSGTEAVALAVNQDGSRIALGGKNDTPDSRRLLDEAPDESAGESSLILVWEVGQWDSPRCVSCPEPQLYSITWLRNGTELIAAGSRGRYLIDSDGNCQLISDSQENAARTSRVLRDDAILVANRTAGTRGQTIAMVAATTGDTLFRFSSPHEGGIGALECDPAEKFLAVPSAVNSISVYDLKTRKKHVVLGGHRNRVTGAKFIGSDRMVSTSDDGTIRVWDVRENPTERVRPAQQLKVPKSPQLKIAPDGQRLAITEVDGIGIWDVPPQRRLRKLPYPSSANAARTELAFSPDSQRLAIRSPVDRGKTTRTQIYDFATNTSRDVDFDLAGNSLCFTPDGQQLIFATMSDSVTFPGQPCGLHLVGVGSQSATQVWLPSADADFWRPHRMGIIGVCVSPEQRRVYSISHRDRSLKAWRMSDGELLFTFKRPLNVFGARAVAVSPDGENVAVGWLDNRITLVSSQGEAIHELIGHSDQVLSLQFTDDSRTLVSSSRDATVKIWDPRIGQLRSTLRGHKSPVVSVAVSPDGGWIISLDESGKLIGWNCDPVDE
ncbi:MAG: hypothetical protein AAF497_17375 [Planctomycetota bacterium]